MIELEDVEAAAQRVASVAHWTPVLTSRTLNDRVGGEVFLKAECLQRSGAFKFRGAYHKIASLDNEQLGRGVVAFSSGNHAQAVALAARLLGTRATILMPEDTPHAKSEATQGYGATILTYDRYSQDRERLACELAKKEGLELVRPYDDPLVMAGQGTAALELIDDVGRLDLLLVPVGGGGLIAGCATAAKGRCSGVRVIGVEPKAGDDTKRSLARGQRVGVALPTTIADGLQATEPGRLTFEVNLRRVDRIVTVSDAEILEAMAFVFDRIKLVTEPSGAVAVAALLASKVEPKGRRVGLIISGGNVGVERFCDLLATR